MRRFFVGALRAVLAGLDPALPMSNVSTLDGIFDREVAQPRFQAGLVGAFALLSLGLALLGLWGTLTQAARQRRREIGIRSALGARRAELIAWLMAFALRPALLGVVAGGVAALGLSRLLVSVLFAVSPADPATYGGAAIAFSMLAALAALPAALRASGVDPMTVLREE